MFLRKVTHGIHGSLYVSFLMTVFKMMTSRGKSIELLQKWWVGPCTMHLLGLHPWKVFLVNHYLDTGVSLLVNF